jgi:propionyl-CoA carboxylase alpha chain
VKLHGWAVESRIYAEDPYRGFLPSTGRLVRYQPPPEGTRSGVTIRNDTGVYEGGEISIYYDPMIAKLCTHAPTRERAIETMGEVLDEFRIDGINHNIDFLNAIMRSGRFREGRLSTAFIAEEYPDGFHGRALDDALARRFAVAALAMKLARTERASRISGALNGAHRPNGIYIASLGETAIDIADARLNGDKLRAKINGKDYEASVLWAPGDALLRLSEAGQTHVFQVARLSGCYRLRHGGANIIVALRNVAAAQMAALMPNKAAADSSKALRCPMPGLVVSVNVKEGQDVKTGEPLAVVEAMKMENVLTAERDAIVKKINVKKGDSLSLDDVIMEFA